MSENATRDAAARDAAVMDVLRGVNDPELGLSIVDLGLVYRAERHPDRIDVAITLTTPSCPLGDLLVQEVSDALHSRFPDGPVIDVELVWEPPWTPDRISEAARQQLG